MTPARNDSCYECGLSEEFCSCECPTCGDLVIHDASGCPEEWRCIFGVDCVMPGEHHRHECATAEMMEMHP